MELIYNMVINISMLVLIATILTKMPLVEKIICDEREQSILGRLLLGAIFGGFCIFSTVTGVQIDGAIPNTRVLGALAAGILCGPTVGVTAGLIGGLHRFFYDINGVTTVACALSTFLEGILGGVIFQIVKRKNIELSNIGLVIITACAEACHMLMLIVFVRPFDMAIHIVNVIAFPMVFFNSIGMLLFFSVFKDVYTRQNLMASDKIRLSLNIADACIPYIRKNPITKEDYSAMEDTICGLANCKNVFFLPEDRKEELFEKGYDFPINFLSKIEKESVIAPVKQDSKSRFFVGIYNAIGCKVTIGTNTWGYLVLIFDKKYTSIAAQKNLAEGLAKFFSTNYELYQVEYQKKMRERAEFRVLQSQINPHFLFNSLNTISCFCREKPEKARELLLALSVYFRHTLNSSNAYMIGLSQEFEQVDAYLMLEKARFEDKLTIEERIPKDIEIQVPTLIVQPIVENAIKHGAMKREKGFVSIEGIMDGEELIIHVSDNGSGIPEGVLAAFNDKTNTGKFGLLNVDGRLRSIYGEKYGLKIDTSENGTTVTMRIPNKTVL